MNYFQRAWERRTTILGYAQVTLGVLAVSDGVLSGPALKWVVLGNGLLTALLGHYNQRKIKQAEGE
jgi:hypothetical protein